MIIIVLFDIDIHIFTVIKVLFNLVVRFKYIKHILFSYIIPPPPSYEELFTPHVDNKNKRSTFK